MQNQYNGKKPDAVIDRISKMEPGPAGLVCAVSKDGETVYSRCEGFADEAAGKKMQHDTIFDIWSLTKVFVCTAAMTLYEQGAFRLNDPLDGRGSPRLRDRHPVDVRLQRSTPPKAEATARSVSSAGQAAPEPGLPQTRRSTSPWSTCTSCGPTWRK